MQYHKHTAETFSLASIRGYMQPIFVANITVDVQTKHSTAIEAAGLLYEELLLSGCANMNREAFLDHVNRLGASITVSFADGRITIQLKATEAKAPTLIKLFEKMLLEPTFAAPELKRAKTLIINKLKEHEEDARSVAHELLANELFAKTDRRYTSSPSTLRKAVANATQRSVRELHHTVRRQYVLASVVGSASVEKKFSRVIENITQNATPNVAKRTHAPTHTKKRLLLHSIQSKQNIEFSIGAHLPLTIHHPNYVPFVFGLAVLGKWGGFAGRLMSTVREKEGLTYGIYVRPESVSGTETGYWRIMTFFSPTQAHQGLSSTAREVIAIAKKGITESEHERFKTILKTQITLLNDAPSQAVDTLHHFHVAGFSIEEMEAHKQKFQTVTQKEINEALKLYLDPSSIIIVGAGPTKGVEKSLKDAFAGGIL